MPDRRDRGSERPRIQGLRTVESEKTSRDRGLGSRPFANRVTCPVLS